MTDEPLFNSTHEALVFAFNYVGQQSPRTPMMSMFKSNPGQDENLPPRNHNIGKGKGLIGLDGAAQAGFILAEVCRLPDDQHNVIVARYYRATHECMCCGSDVPREEWKAAIDALSHCVELEGVHRRVRLMMVEKAVFGSGISAVQLANQYSLSERTLQRQYSLIRTKFQKIRNSAMSSLDNAFYGKKDLVA